MPNLACNERGDVILEMPPLTSQNSSKNDDESSLTLSVGRSVSTSSPEQNMLDLNSDSGSNSTSLEQSLLIVGPNNEHSMVTRAKAGIVWPKYPFISLAKASFSMKPSLEPCDVREALSSQEWRHAMTIEIQALLRNHTWSLVLYNNQKLIGNK